MEVVTRLIRRLIRVLVLLLVLGVLVNDGVRTARAVASASDGMKAAMDAAIDAVRENPGASAQPLASAAAQAQGATLESYEQAQAPQASNTRVGITVSVSAPLVRTVVAGPVYGLATGVPADALYAPEGVEVTLKSHKVVTEFGTGP